MDSASLRQATAFNRLKRAEKSLIAEYNMNISQLVTNVKVTGSVWNIPESDIDKDLQVIYRCSPILEPARSPKLVHPVTLRFLLDSPIMSTRTMCLRMVANEEMPGYVSLLDLRSIQEMI